VVSDPGHRRRDYGPRREEDPGTGPRGDGPRG
jgi:hypothetical protein